MTQHFSIWLLILLAVVAANLPFLSDRLLLLWRLRGGPKGLGWRLLELVLWYFAVGGIGLALEQRAGQIYPQGWQFYAVTGALFLTFAFPGFVYRYLVLRGR